MIAKRFISFVLYFLFFFIKRIPLNTLHISSSTAFWNILTPGDVLILISQQQMDDVQGASHFPTQYQLPNPNGYYYQEN